MKDETIKICSNHQEKEETPLIWTFAFDYCEYWCPACGWMGGMLGAGSDVPWTQKLQDRHDLYKKQSRRFLRANGALSCARLKRKGEWTTFSELPLKAKQYHRSQSKKWKYKF